MSVGIVVPGVSSTVTLMCLGIYSNYLEAVSSINLSILFPIGIGILLGSAIFLKLIQFLLNRFYPQTFYTIIGFVLGSILVLFPNLHFMPSGSFRVEDLFLIAILLISFIIGLFLGRLEKS